MVTNLFPFSYVHSVHRCTVAIPPRVIDVLQHQLAHKRLLRSSLRYAYQTYYFPKFMILIEIYRLTQVSSSSYVDSRHFSVILSD